MNPDTLGKTASRTTFPVRRRLAKTEALASSRRNLTTNANVHQVRSLFLFSICKGTGGNVPMGGETRRPRVTPVHSSNRTTPSSPMHERAVTYHRSRPAAV